MGFADDYLTLNSKTKGLIDTPPARELKAIIIIPCYNEPDIINTLDALHQCEPMSHPHEIIVLINSSENSPDNIIINNKNTLKKIIEWKKSHNITALHAVNITNLPKKQAGAGMARKTAMDEAVYRFNLINQDNGIIISMDADMVCSSNYLKELENTYSNHPNTIGTHAYFEHPVDGNQFTKEVYNAIIKYELYLRFFVEGLRFINYPYAFHTLGSCFSVTAKAYVKQGGMNKKQGGEDFYFLHKLFPFGHFRELNDVIINPSPRPSNRVPFGTGPAVSKIIENNNYMVYEPKSFSALQYFFNNIDEFYQAKEKTIQKVTSSLDKPLNTFLLNNKITEKIEEINRHTSSKKAFIKRFFRWFNAFMIIKFLNESHLSYYKKIPVQEAASQLLIMAHHNKTTNNDDLSLLNIYRNIQKEDCFVC